MNSLDNKITLISGAARGIGAATAQLMSQAGARVVVGDILDERGRETVRAIENSGGEALYVHLDVTSDSDWQAAVNATVKRIAGLDILVNNAGMFLGKTTEEASLADWHKICGINLTGVFLGTKLALPALRDRGKSSRHGSAIVNLSSVAGIVGAALDPLYSLTKGGVALFTKSPALEFARKGYRVRVNSIHPGVISTDMGDQVFVSAAHFAGTNNVDPVRQMVLQNRPIGRFGTPEDIAKGIVFPASDDAGFMTGSGLVVDGGWTAQ